METDLFWKMEIKIEQRLIKSVATPVSELNGEEEMKALYIPRKVSASMRNHLDSSFIRVRLVGKEMNKIGKACHQL